MEHVVSKKKIANASFFDDVKAMLAQGKSVKIPVVGNSMKPFLRHGDVVLRKLFEGDPSRGKIVLAYFNQTYVLHRVVRQKADRVVLAGDANLWQLEEVCAEDILAVATQAYRGERDLRIDTAAQLRLGILWYKLRLVRAVYNKLFKG
jgi:signal peptidase I